MGNHETCIFYNDKLHRCSALIELVCKDGKCSFYKSERGNEDDKSGTNQKDEAKRADYIFKDV